MTSEASASGAPVGLREKARIERYQNIRAAAEQLFNERGYEHTTTKEVAELAGVGEATLFRYVSNKHELLLLVIGERMDTTLQAIEDADKELAANTSTARDYVERIYAIFRARARFYATDPENVTSYLHHGFKAGSQLGAQSISQGDRVIALIAAILDDARKAGYLSADVDSLIVAQNCNGTYIHEILRTPARGFRPEDLWEKLRERLRVQIEPLFRF
ncbi:MULTISPECIES: TetR/AcrR family transcriptional regulator [Micrococcaceae]|uniref:TetR/AcrR family transcriptional regulator n=1 Tax=Micrococcaceae TaxID=1268 RepID=UPI0018D21ED6|nr:MULTISPECIES: TetR/AcrR family transcriptional regulator [Pseudarthrobacter]MEA3551269.1 TetR/AcrR family transcriptional regulator [Pseudarthrobacter sp. C1]WPU08991.1 TetR/AcrR family transcriptional regulator [Pseudarthrobacter oxydans]HET7782625.1 TetR/AcrR family transcriptional regulator [Arthrobacter sp.]